MRKCHLMTKFQPKFKIEMALSITNRRISLIPSTFRATRRFFSSSLSEVVRFDISQILPKPIHRKKESFFYVNVLEWISN